MRMYDLPDSRGHFGPYGGVFVAETLSQALDELLEIVRRDKTWRDGEARRQILNILNLAADQSLASEYRRKLASAIY